MTEWTLGAVLDAIADEIPDRLMTVCGDRRSTFAESAIRTRRFANFLSSRGFGAHRERAALDRWECGQDRVALIMHNDLYPDMLIGCLKARTVPVNINHSYSPREVGELFRYVRPRVVIYHRSLGARFAEVLTAGCAVLVSIDDGSGATEVAGSVSLEDALAQGDTDHIGVGSPDDLMMICTGGTTGSPKGVLWRQSDIYVSSMGGDDHTDDGEIHDKVREPNRPWMAVSPLMHAAGMWTAFSAIFKGRAAVLQDNRFKFDAKSVLEIAQRENVELVSIVGDAFAGPLVAELRRHAYDLPSLSSIGTGGAATNQKYKRALMECLPQVTIIDGYGSSETGSLGFGRSHRGIASDTFVFREGGAVVSADRTRFLKPGDDEIGWAARTGRIPLGYFNASEATQQTFPEIEGQRLVIPGDRATLEHDGTVRLLGRDSLVVNTGGEKVFVEEVEEVLRAHPNVADAVVVGRPSQRWGSEVVAVVALREAADADRDALCMHCRSRLARFKVPKIILFVEQVRRLGNGKADYRWAKAIAGQDVALDFTIGSEA